MYFSKTARSISEEFSSGDASRFRDNDDSTHTRDRGDKQKKEQDDRDEGGFSCTTYVVPLIVVVVVVYVL